MAKHFFTVILTVAHYYVVFYLGYLRYLSLATPKMMFVVVFCFLSIFTTVCFLSEVFCLPLRESSTEYMIQFSFDSEYSNARRFTRSLRFGAVEEDFTSPTPDLLEHSVNSDSTIFYLIVSSTIFSLLINCVCLAFCVYFVYISWRNGFVSSLLRISTLLGRLHPEFRQDLHLNTQGAYAASPNFIINQDSSVQPEVIELD